MFFLVVDLILTEHTRLTDSSASKATQERSKDVTCQTNQTTRHKTPTLITNFLESVILCDDDDLDPDQYLEDGKERKKGVRSSLARTYHN